MKKIAFVALFATLILGGCSSSGDKAEESKVSASSTTVESTVESTTESKPKADLTYFYKDKKDTTKLSDLHISVHSKLDNDNYKELDILSSKFEPGKDVFVYVDGEQANIDSELATGLRTATPIAADQIKKGEHSVELAQYENDDDTTEPVLYVRSSYTID
ncbi:hypothetical protein [Enterococcus sp.]|uniref:hypothetical protein n=1 Tax=Enterococcus sp. TaxID=35783 RepID=UPI002FCCAF81